MSAVLPAPDASALTLFPIYTTLGDMAARETDGLTDAQWEWYQPQLELVRLEHPTERQPRRLPPLPPLPPLPQLGRRPLSRSEALLGGPARPGGPPPSLPRRVPVAKHPRGPGEAGAGPGPGAGHPHPRDCGLRATEDHRPARRLLLRHDRPIATPAPSSPTPTGRASGAPPWRATSATARRRWPPTSTMSSGSSAPRASRPSSPSPSSATGPSPAGTAAKPSAFPPGGVGATLVVALGGPPPRTRAGRASTPPASNLLRTSKGFAPDDATCYTSLLGWDRWVAGVLSWRLYWWGCALRCRQAKRTLSPAASRRRRS